MENKKVLTILLIIFLFSITFLTFYTVKATSYEWIDNPSFEDGLGEELIRNGDFESGTFSDGWSQDGTVAIVTSGFHSATHSVLYNNDASDNLNHYLEENITTSSILSWSVYYGSDSTLASGWWLYVGYNDGTQEGMPLPINYTYPEGQSIVWVKIDLLNHIDLDEGKLIQRFWIQGSAGSGAYVWFDDFSMRSAIIGQTEITESTFPWYDEDLKGKDTDQLINTTLGHYGECSYQSRFVQPKYFCYQDIPFLYTNNIQEFSLWVRNTGSGLNTMLIELQYSDGYTYQVEKDYASLNEWTKLDFTSYIETGRILTKIGFKPLRSGTDGTYVNVDDVSLLATLPRNDYSFKWWLSPAPILKTNTMFKAYSGRNYLFFGEIYDENGTLTENGNATITSTWGLSTTVTITNGRFNFTIIPPTISYSVYESILFDVVLETRYFVLGLNAQWEIVPVPTGTGGWNPEETNPILSINIVGAFILIIVMSVLFGVLAGKDGLLVGLMLSIFISSLSGLLPIYGIIIAIIIGIITVISHTGIGREG